MESSNTGADMIEDKETFNVTDVLEMLNFQEIASDFSNDEIEKAQEEDRYCQTIRQKLETRDRRYKRVLYRFRVLNNLLLRKKRGKSKENSIFQIVLPTSMISTILRAYHDSHNTGGHCGTDKCEQNIEKYYWFPQMREIIRTYIKNCIVCQRTKASNALPYGISRIIESPEQPFEAINMDICGPYKESYKGNKYIITCVDRLTRYVTVRAVPNQLTNTIIKFLNEEVIMKYNTPKKITTDRGPQFMSAIFQSQLRGMGISHNPTASYYAAADGLAEVNNRKVINIIKSYVNHRARNWDEYVDIAAKMINRQINKITGYSPFFLLFGYNPINTFERRLDVRQLEETNVDDEDEPQQLSVLQARQEAKENVEKAEQKWAEFRNRSLRTPPFKYGDLIWTIDRTVEVNTPLKLRAQNCGPYVIIKEVTPGTYRIVRCRKGNDRIKVVNSRVCFPYCGPNPRQYRTIIEKADRGDYESIPSDGEEEWDIEDYVKWCQMRDEDLRQQTGQQNRDVSQSEYDERYQSQTRASDRPVSDISFESQPLLQISQSQSHRSRASRSRQQSNNLLLTQSQDASNPSPQSNPNDFNEFMSPREQSNGGQRNQNLSISQNHRIRSRFPIRIRRRPKFYEQYIVN